MSVIRPGWCCRPACPSPVGCACVIAPGVLPELCLSCAAIELGLPDGSGAGAIQDEVQRRTVEAGL